jgi:WXXGXW repeat (2 copies)
MKRYLMALALTAQTLGPLPAWANTRVYVQIGPPAAIVETRVVAPTPHHVWIEGYHRWDGRAYTWVPGRWELPPARHTAWVAGHWTHHSHNGWYWTEGHWK